MRKKFRFSTTHILMLSFLCTILLGSLLLALPVSSGTNTPVPYIDALFTATTATCVTGLVTVPVFTAFSTFGHAVILCLIQIGGLGVITVLSAVTMFFMKKMSLSDRLLLQDAFNLSSMAGIRDFLKKVVGGTLLVEFIGALCYMPVFIPDFGARGIWISFFTSISAFCNAGIDIFAADSLCRYALNPVVNIVTCLLIVLGGLGYIVWWDLLRVWKEAKGKRGKWFCHLTLHSKIALVTTAILIFGGALLIFAAEYHNPLTMQNNTFFEKVGMSLFQSVTTRTAGYATIPQQNLTNAGAMVSILLMFIGGSPVGTAGGVKTVTVAVLAATAYATIRNKDEITLFHRSLHRQAVSKAVAVVAVFAGIVFISTLLLSLTTDAPVLDLMYETVSATATVGLTRDLTPHLSAAGKLIIISDMYLGRVGPISLAVAFSAKNPAENSIKNPTEDISVG